MILKRPKMLPAAIFLLQIAKCWEIMPKEVDENAFYDKTSRDTKGHIDIIQNKDAVDYRMHGIDAQQFELEIITDGTCGNNFKTCAKLWLKPGVELDREVKDTYNIQVEAIDRNRGTLEHSTMIINVADENDNIPIFTAASTILKCPENARNGASCGNVQALDKDSGAFGRVEYFRPDQKEQWKKRDGSFENDREYGMFNVDKESGEITLNNPTNWDAETYEYVVITVQARDNPNKVAYSKSDEQKITIYVSDVNDNEPQVQDYEKTISVGELAKQGTNIGTENFKDFSFRATDKDIDGDNRDVTFEIVSPLGAPFDVINKDNPENSALLQVGKDGLDFETTPQWTLNIRAINKQGKPVQFKDFTVLVTVEDENEPPEWEDNQIRMKEGDKKGAMPSSHPHAIDRDFGGSQTVTYDIITDPENYFNIDRQTGRLTYRSDEPLDRECIACNWHSGTYPLTLSACDELKLCNTKTFDIFITDVNDEGPRLEIDGQDTSVCNVLDDSYVIVNGKREIEVIDRDDCKLGHCGPFKLKVAGPNSKHFNLIQASDSRYMLRFTGSGDLESRTIYEMQVVGEDSDGNRYTSTVKLSVCSCESFEDTPSCNALLVAGGENNLAVIMAIIAAVLIVFIVALLLIVYRVRHRGHDGKDAHLLDDDDDERANIMVYHTEGGGEEDQEDFDPQSLVRARAMQQDHAGKRPTRPTKDFTGLPPDDIRQYINAAKQHADEDPSSPPYDSLLTFDYEGGNSLCGDLSSLASNDQSDLDEDVNYLTNWGPKFRKLADLYGGRENESFDPSNV